MQTTPASVSECDHCGLCCRKLIVEAVAMDVLREPRIASVGRHMDGHGTLPILDSAWSIAGADGECVFHKDDRCSIYHTRPDECVAFFAGSAKCRELRESAGLQPLAKLQPRSVCDAIAAAVLSETE